MSAFVGEAAANHCCDAVNLIEKTSMEELQHVGLVTDPQAKRIYINKFGASLISGVDYQVYISAKHGNGAGQYAINKVTVNGKNVSLSLDFLVGIFEAGAAVMNQRVLFFKTDPGCRIIDVITANKPRKNS